ncbi:hypothetical protein CYY_008598 [Polysphondylium violaceum]|uniref:Letm1 RBD domain-containing protein n=1 Tax=Polysphondylium violaceum TaxID=133409 RepID=A0A8J4PMR7_9MYCE|nr:hypothetical protein CYY_008598 [Polysphondylium violaceum]
MNSMIVHSQTANVAAQVGKLLVQNGLPAMMTSTLTSRKYTHLSSSYNNTNRKLNLVSQQQQQQPKQSKSFINLYNNNNSNIINEINSKHFLNNSSYNRLFSTSTTPPPTDKQDTTATTTTANTTTTTTAAKETAVDKTATIKRKYSEEEDVIVSIEPKPEKGDKKDLMAKIKGVANHYWYGTKLLGKNIGIGIHLIKRIIKGHTLTRRERRLLSQTSADAMRIIPFIIIVLVPFLEFALPIILKFFPNLLPSTYTHENEKLEGKTLRSKGNMSVQAQLKDLLHELSVDSKKNTNSTEFYDFMTKVKMGETVTAEQVLKYSKFFKDDIIMEKITRPQLLSMHRYLAGGSPLTQWYSNEYLKDQIYKKLEKIKQDDILIKKEGLNSLTLEELVDAAIVRGFKVEGYNRKFIEGQLDQWLDLSLNKSLPPSILILSRAFILSPNLSAPEALEDTLEHIPQQILKEVAKELPADLSTEAGVEMAKEKLDELTKEQAEIKVEESQEEKEAAEAAAAAPEKVESTTATTTIPETAQPEREDLKKKSHSVSDDDDIEIHGNGNNNNTNNSATTTTTTTESKNDKQQ